MAQTLLRRMLLAAANVELRGVVRCLPIATITFARGVRAALLPHIAAIPFFPALFLRFLARDFPRAHMGAGLNIYGLCNNCEFPVKISLSPLDSALSADG
jgi:hypothetical protein